MEVVIHTTLGNMCHQEAYHRANWLHFCTLLRHEIDHRRQRSRRHIGVWLSVLGATWYSDGASDPTTVTPPLASMFSNTY
ncbi:hypothetical protein MTR_2g033100 [Medicago truncatula]|uniref:Uncharacterized protein n=1 Tax=Medicago truncatula TaxID=3880 RepID=G7IL29_MEDTR|nr:hypothetical protein MTR_2g033100 [Medicago truncatula]